MSLKSMPSSSLVTMFILTQAACKLLNEHLQLIWLVQVMREMEAEF